MNFQNRLPDFVDLSFVHDNGTSTSMRLYSKYSCIYGVDSGEGKTAFLAFLNQHVNEIGNVKLISSDGSQVVLYDFPAMRSINLDDGSRHIVVIDEIFLLRSDLVSKMNKDNNLYVGVARSAPGKCLYPLCGMYKVSYLEDETFDLEQIVLLDLANDFSKLFKIILVESNREKSEHELLTKYLGDSVIASCGAGRLERYLRHSSDNILVLADLGNIGQELGILRKRQEDNPSIKFYDYACFEELLYFSRVVSRRSVKTNLDYFSIERFYEEVLSEVTNGAYVHGKSLDSMFLNNFNSVFNTEVGKGLYEYIKRYGVV